MINKQTIWWTGVVEDRDDPEKLGRCRVRIFGYHPENKADLPTNELPWAIPILPITSASTSGVGISPTGIVPGSWVVGWFLDGEDGQQPLYIGTIPGYPETEESARKAKEEEEKQKQNYLRDSDDRIIYDTRGNPIPARQQDVLPEETRLPISTSEEQRLLDYLGGTLSQNDYTKEGDQGQLGKYQFNLDTLQKFGYVKTSLDSSIPENQIMSDPTFWSGKSNIRSKEDFLSNRTSQETLAREVLKQNYFTMVNNGILQSGSKRLTGQDLDLTLGLLSSSFIAGPENADKLDKKDKNGRRAKDYFTGAINSFGGDSQTAVRATEFNRSNLPREPGRLNNSNDSKNKGFRDPENIYPKKEYADLTDVNKLCVSNETHQYFDTKRKNKVTNIPIANSSSTWDEPDPAYSAEYPYNQVLETEAGHVIEIDNTKDAERIHIFHKNGTYIEIDANGSLVKKTVGEEYELIDRNNFVYVKGAKTLTVEGKTNIYVKDDASIQIDGDATVNAHGDTLLRTAGLATITCQNASVNATESLDVVAGRDLTLQGRNVNINAVGGDIKLRSDINTYLESVAGIMNIRGGVLTAIDARAGVVTIKTGSSEFIPVQAIVAPTIPKKSPSKQEISELKRNTVYKEETFLFDSEDPENEEYVEKQKKEGKINDKVILNFENQNAEDLAKGRNLSDLGDFYGKSDKLVTTKDSSEFKGYDKYSDNLKLSKYFSLGDFTKNGNKIQDQKNLTSEQIVTNLSNLAVNSLDRIKERYPDMLITSGFRREGKDSASSEHLVGAAADMVFTRTDWKDYKEIAQWIQGNVPYRQLLLEYRTNNSSNKIDAVWIHLSLQTSGNDIIPSNKTPVATFLNHQPYAKNRLLGIK